MSLPPGTKLGPYEIVASIGAGGMGEVYRARDPRIGRDVAIKVLPAAFSQDPERLRRFEQEARSAGVLNHPNILAIYDVGTHDATPYVVSELLDGETLRERVKIGAIPPRKSIEIAVQIARGLAAAHEHGIVHRDLKPENLFVTKDGRVKILDFGLAKLTAPEREGAGRTDANTLPVDTGPGAVWGTVGYMSPEQVRGTPVDARSDIFGFGAILYEMLSGRRAFHGETPADTMSAILKEDPPELAASNEAIPPALERVVRHCLEKSPGERFQSARDLAFNLEAISDSGRTGPLAAAAPPRWSRSLRFGAIAAGVAALVAAAGVIPSLLRPRGSDSPMRLTVEPPPRAQASYGVFAMSISPDGRWVVFGVADSTLTTQLWRRRLDSPSAEPILGTNQVGAGWVFWSPDSRNLGFAAGGKLKRVPISGGPVETICDASDPRGAAWNKDGDIVFAPGSTGGLFRVSADGGQPVAVTDLDSTRHETAHRWPSFLPDGHHFTYVALPSASGEFDCFVGSLESKRRKPLMKCGRAPVYAEPGYLLFSRNDILMAQRIDPRGLELKGKPVTLAEVPLNQGAVAMPLASVTTERCVAYLMDHIPNTQIQMYSVTGKFLSTISAPTGRYEGVAAGSPDGKRAVVMRRESMSNRDLWLVDLERNTTSRFTFEPGNETNPIWSRDGSRVAFLSDRRGGVNDIYWKSADGGDEEVLYGSSEQWKMPQDFSPDGRYFVFGKASPKTLDDIWLLPMSGGDRQPILYLGTPASENGGVVSPNGRWLAYDSDESGQEEVYVQSFPTPGHKRQVSTGGGSGHCWNREGTAIYYGLLGDKGYNLVRVPVAEDGANLELGHPDIAGNSSLALVQRYVGGTLMSDCARFLSELQDEGNPTSTPTLIVNWPALVKGEK